MNCSEFKESVPLLGVDCPSGITEDMDMDAIKLVSVHASSSSDLVRSTE